MRGGRGEIGEATGTCLPCSGLRAIFVGVRTAGRCAWMAPLAEVRET